MRLKILFVTNHKPWPPQYGTAIRVSAQIDALESFADVDIVILGKLGDLKSEAYYNKRNVVAEIPWSAGLNLRPIQKLLLTFSDRGDWLVTYIPWFEKLLKAPNRIREKFQNIASRGYDILFIVRPESYWYLSPKQWRPIVDIDDVQTLHAKESIKSDNSFIKLLALKLRYKNLKRSEKALFKSISSGLVCSQEDAKYLGYPNIDILPNPIPNQEQKDRQILIGSSTKILFVGTLKYKPNLNAIQYFSNKVLKIIRQKIPECTLSVAGSYRDEDVSALINEPGLVLFGFVENLVESLEDSAIVIAPLLEGLGTRLKILEALSFGKPVVATHLGAYGIPFDQEDGLFRTDDPQEMADICLRLMQNSDERLAVGKNGKRRVYEFYGRQAFNERMRAIVYKTLTPTSNF